MRLLIDGTEIALNGPESRTFSAVIEEAVRRAAADCRIVHRIEVDGTEISTQAEREMANRPAVEVGEIHLRTTTSQALLGEALEGAIQLSRALREDIRSVLASLRSGDVSAAKSLYVSCVESLGTFFQLAGAVFNGVRTGAFRLTDAVSEGRVELPEPPSSTTEILKRLLSAHQEDEWSRMADLLEEEVIPNLEEWSRFFSAMMGSQPR